LDHAIADGIYAEFAQYFNAGDMEGLLGLYEPDAVFVRGPGGKPFTATGQTAEVLRRQPDGRWLYINDHPAGAQD
jgi:ketosteroid isomerase-like protein